MAQRIICTIFLIHLALLGIAQQWSAGVFLGGSNYQGDLVESQLLMKETNFAYGVFGRYQLHPKIAIKGNLYFGMLSGNDMNFSTPAFHERGFNFTSNIVEGGVNIEWDFLGQPHLDNKGNLNRNFTPYLFTGVGAMKFSPNTNLDSLAAANNTGEPAESKVNYGIFNFMIPIGGGIKYNLTRRVSLGLEFATHLPFSDYLDGISDSASGLSGKQNNDWYLFGGLQISYWFQVPNRKGRTGGSSFF